MSHCAEILDVLEEVLAHDVRLSGAPLAPQQFLTVVDFFGEPMDGDPHFRTMAHWKSSDFTGRFRRWLGEMSHDLSGSSVSDAAEELRASTTFHGQFLVFTRLSDFATWYDDPTHTFLDAYVTFYVNNGLAIFSVSPFMDGHAPKLRRKHR